MEEHNLKREYSTDIRKILFKPTGLKCFKPKIKDRERMCICSSQKSEEKGCFYSLNKSELQVHVRIDTLLGQTGKKLANSLWP